jgi:hypothetical protein
VERVKRLEKRIEAAARKNSSISDREGGIVQVIIIYQDWDNSGTIVFQRSQELCIRLFRTVYVPAHDM